MWHCWFGSLPAGQDRVSCWASPPEGPQCQTVPQSPTFPCQGAAPILCTASVYVLEACSPKVSVSCHVKNGHVYDFCPAMLL